MPIYALYALLFADHGLSDGQISALFAIWSTVAVLTEVPTGAIADRFSRRGTLAGAGVFQASSYACWVLFPSFTGFAAGFVLWGVGGSLSSGSLEALLYDELLALGEEGQYARLNSRITAVELVAQVPTAVIASVLFSLGGYALAGWVSVASCLASAALAWRLPETPRSAEESEEDGYLATLWSGVRQVRSSRSIRWAVLCLALVFSLDAFEEYFTLMAHDWSVPTVWVPVATLGVPLAGALGAYLAGRMDPRPWLLVLSAGLLIAAALIARPHALVIVAAFYGLYHFVLVHVEAELQHRIGDSSARATVTSVSGLGSELASYLTFAAWVVHGPLAVGVLVLLVGVVILRR